MWRLDQPEKVALVDQDIELGRAVPAVIPIVKVNPKPDAPLAVENVDGTAIERVGMGQKDHDGGWELNPPEDLGKFSKLEKFGCGFVEGFLFA